MPVAFEIDNYNPAWEGWRFGDPMPQVVIVVNYWPSGYGYHYVVPHAFDVQPECEFPAPGDLVVVPNGGSGYGQTRETVCVTGPRWERHDPTDDSYGRATVRILSWRPWAVDTQRVDVVVQTALADVANGPPAHPSALIVCRNGYVVRVVRDRVQELIGRELNLDDPVQVMPWYGRRRTDSAYAYGRPERVYVV